MNIRVAALWMSLAVASSVGISNEPELIQDGQRNAHWHRTVRADVIHNGIVHQQLALRLEGG
jgi:hypothetical protein